jgi:hypothetical protein
MSNVRQLLEARRAAIDAEMQPLFKDHELQRAKLIELETKMLKLREERDEIEGLLKKLGEQPPRITIMEAIMVVLDHKPNGMTANEILAELNEKYFGGELMRHSLSPQLSRLKDRDKKIELRGDRWIKLPTQPSLFTRRV